MKTPDISSIDLKPEQLQLVQNILGHRVPDAEIWAFGSRTNGTAKPFSDLDLAINNNQPLSMDTRAALADDFAESDLPFKVDIIDWQCVNEDFRRIIETHKILLTDKFC